MATRFFDIFCASSS